MNQFETNCFRCLLSRKYYYLASYEQWWLARGASSTVCNILDGAWSKKNWKVKFLHFYFYCIIIYWCNKVLFLFSISSIFSQLLCIHHNAIVALTSGINVKERNRSKKWRRNTKERYNSQMCSTKIINIQEWWSTETK